MLKSPATFRRTAAGLALIVSSVGFVVAALLTAGAADETAAYLEDVAESPGAFAASGLIEVVSFPLLLVGVLAIVHLIRGRGVTLAHLGGVLAVVGLGAFPALAVTQVVDSIAVEAISQGEYATLIDQGFEDSAAAIVLLIVILVPGLVGALLIGAALLRSGLAPWWAGAAIIVGTVLLVPGGGALFVAGNVLHLIGFATAGIVMLRMSDADWERPPLDWRGGKGERFGARGAT